MRYLLILILTILFGCNSGIDDKNKRNQNWCWWIDAKTGKGQWIPVAKYTTVKDGRYTLFYFNGAVFETGKMLNGQRVDTAFKFDWKGKLYAYHLFNLDSNYYLQDGYVKIYNQHGNLTNEGLIRNHSSCCATWIDYYENGNKEFKRDFLSQDTAWEVDYYENGQVKDSSFFKKDSVWSVKSWYEDGKVHKVLEWGKDLSVKHGTEYLTDGEIKRWGKINGDKDLLHQEWYASGQLHYEWLNPPNGIWKEFYKSGRLKALAIRKLNEPVEAKTFDEAGNITAIYKNGDWVKP